MLLWFMMAAAVVTAATTKAYTEVPEPTVWTVDGVRREGLVWNGAGTSGRPLVVVLHGGTRSPRDVDQETAWPRLAEEKDFILIAPAGVNGQWNDGRDITASGQVSRADDVALLREVIRDAVSRLHADASRVYVTGVSNGGLMTFRFACEAPDAVAAIAPSLAKLPIKQADRCRDRGLPPLLLIAGTADPVMAFQGEPAPPFRPSLGSHVLMSVPATLRAWASANGCGAGEASEPIPDRSERDLSTALHFRFTACPSTAAVEALIIQGGGHREPSIVRCEDRLPPSLAWLGSRNCDVETAELSWSFLSRYRRKEP